MIRTREKLLELEELRLLPWAQKTALTAGRGHPEPPHPFRTEYQRDHARIIHSRAFRRLEGKTQVFLSGSGDHLRTRLTHTMEVASITGCIARALGLNEDLAQAIALAHDLGHPPFGHTGEARLDEKMRGHGGFEHNEQSLRIVDRLEKKYPHIGGLNLTHELLEGLRKHRAPLPPPPGSDAPGHPSPSLEAQAADLADEIAYYSHDLDDGLESGLISPAQLEPLEVWRTTRRLVESRFPGIAGRELHANIIRTLIDREVEDVIETSHRRLICAEIKSADDARQHPEKLVAYSGPLRAQNQELRRFLFANLYQHPEVARANREAGERLGAVFDAYLGHPEWLAGSAAGARVATDGLHRAVCDHLAGMTDRYLLGEHARIFG